MKGSLFGIPTNSHGSFSSMNSSSNFWSLGCKRFDPPILNMNRTHNFRITFGIHDDVLHELFVHHDVPHECLSSRCSSRISRSSRCSGYFSHFSNFSKISLFRPLIKTNCVRIVWTCCLSTVRGALKRSVQSRGGLGKEKR